MAEEKTTTKPKGNLNERYILYLEELKSDANITEEQREQANEDTRFIHVPGGMWEGFFEESNTSDPDNERVRLQFDLVSEFRDRFIGNWNTNRIGVEFKPDDSKASDEDADLINGIYRTDHRQFSGKMATDNAVDEVADVGYGCFKLASKFEDEEDPENDNQRIEWRPIHNAHNTVIWDANAKRIDKRDALRCIELTEFTKDAFEKLYPGKVVASAWTPENQWWFNTSINQPDIIYIATRYDVIRKKESVFVYRNLQTEEIEHYTKDEHELIEDELKANEFVEFVRERKVIKQTIERSIFSGDDWLETPRRIPGKFIPIIAMYAYRGFVSGVEWYHGLIRNLKDANRVWNMQISQIAENAASGNDNKPIFAPEQMPANIEQHWANKTNLPWLPALPLRDKEGNIINAGPLGWTQSQQIDQNTAALMDIIPQFIQSTTGGAPQDTIDPNASGKAINAMLKRENMKTQPIMDNIANSIEWSGEVYLAMAVEIYDTKRMVRVTGRDGTQGQKQLFDPILDEETGIMVEGNTIRGKKFKAYSDAGPAYESQREATVEDGKEMIKAFEGIPGGEKYTAALMSIIIENMTGTELGPLKKINRNDMVLQGLVPPETPEEEALLEAAKQPQEDPNQELISSLSNQANADAQKLEAEARNMDSDSVDNIASAEKKAAETRKIISETENAKAKTLFDIRKETFDRVTALPL